MVFLVAGVPGGFPVQTSWRFLCTGWLVERKRKKGVDGHGGEGRSIFTQMMGWLLWQRCEGGHKATS